MPANRRANDGACNGRDIRPFLAFLVPLVAVLGIVWPEKAERTCGNLHFHCGCPSGFDCPVVVPAVLGGTCFEYNIWQVFTNAPLLAVDGPGFFSPASPPYVDRNHHVCNRLHADCMNMLRPGSTRFSQFLLSATMGVRFQHLHHLFLLRDALWYRLSSGHPHAGQGG